MVDHHHGISVSNRKPTVTWDPTSHYFSETEEAWAAVKLQQPKCFKRGFMTRAETLFALPAQGFPPEHS